MIELTPLQRQAVAQHGEAPLCAVDLETDTRYVLIREDVYRRGERSGIAQPSLNIENVPEDLLQKIEARAAAEQVPVTEEALRLLQWAMYLNQTTTRPR